MVSSLRRGGREVQGEGGALEVSGAGDVEPAAEFFGGEDAGVQAEAVAFAAGGEAVQENFFQVFGGDADAVVDHGEGDPAGGVAGADGDAEGFDGRGGVIHGVFGVADEVYEDLQHADFFHGDAGGGGEVADDLHVVPGEGGGVEAEGVFDEVGGVEGFEQAALHGVGLLHGDDVLDVVDVLLEGVDFGEEAVAFVDEVGAEGLDVGGELVAFGVVGDEVGQVVGVGGEEFAGLDEVGGFGVAEAVGDEGGGDVDAVEHVADVVQDAGGDLGHAGLVGGAEEFLAGLVEGFLGLAFGGDVFAEAEGADDGAGVVAEGEFGG